MPNFKLYSIKYNVPSKGLMNNDTWRIYEDINETVEKAHYVDHVELINVESWTGENLFRVGYSLMVEGVLSFDTDPNTEKRYAIIHNGTYVVEEL